MVYILCSYFVEQSLFRFILLCCFLGILREILDFSRLVSCFFILLNVFLNNNCSANNFEVNRFGIEKFNQG